jgi:flagellar protein FlaI
MDVSVIEDYSMVVDNVNARIRIKRAPYEYVPIYDITYPVIEEPTKVALDELRERLINEIIVEPTEIVTPQELENLKKKFFDKALEMLRKEFPHLSESEKKTLIGILIHESFGLGVIEVLLQDRNLEEIVVNDSKSPAWVYHIRLGWLKTNIQMENEIKIYNYAAAIGRRVGEQITNLKPLMDAYLSTGDRINATLFPISSHGNTFTIRKFARRPWTITDFIEAKTLSSEVAAFLWLAIQYELNAVIAGGTASGKTSLLNALTCFIPPNQRLISIEDTREIQLPIFLHWVPMTTRPPNPEGRGEISMLQLMINSLRMRPDRIIVGEIRRKREAEVLFEAINTGHSVYSTLHANTSEEAFRRLVNPPINIPTALLGGLQLVVVMHRDRRRGIRRVLHVSELIPSTGLKEMKMELNTVFQWIPSDDNIMKTSKSYRVLNDIKLYTGMSDRDIEKDIKEKQTILEWLVKNQIKDINKVGKIISEYYRDPKTVLKEIKSGRFFLESKEKVREATAAKKGKDEGALWGKLTKKYKNK